MFFFPLQRTWSLFALNASFFVFFCSQDYPSWLRSLLHQSPTTGGVVVNQPGLLFFYDYMWRSGVVGSFREICSSKMSEKTHSVAQQRWVEAVFVGGACPGPPIKTSNFQEISKQISNFRYFFKVTLCFIEFYSIYVSYIKMYLPILLS